MHEETKEITGLILEAAKKARKETSSEPEPGFTQPITWPIQCTVGPGLEGAIACETNVGYVNGAKGWLIYRGYDIFELCAYSTFEEVSYLLLHGRIPNSAQLKDFKKKLFEYTHIPKTKRRIMSFPIEEMNTMAALRFGIGLMRQQQTYRDIEGVIPIESVPISSDEDSIPMETPPKGEPHAVYEFKGKAYKRPQKASSELLGSEDMESCYRLIAGVSSITATIARVRQGHLPIEPDPELSHAGNLLYMMTGRKPSSLEERIMDVALILHADHGMNASTFTAMVVASTLSDIYFSIDAAVAALSGPLHGGANQRVHEMLTEIGGPDNVKAWYKKAMKEKRKIMGVGHRVYKAYDPRARVLGPLAERLADKNRRIKPLFKTAQALENEVCSSLGKEKCVFPNVDFYSGLIYSAMGISPDLYTPIFAVSRVSGWTARVLEYLKDNRIFRPRAVYLGEFDKKLNRGV